MIRNFCAAIREFCLPIARLVVSVGWSSDTPPPFLFCLLAGRHRNIAEVFPNLKWLSMRNNKLKSLRGVAALTSLVVLHVGSNKVGLGRDFLFIWEVGGWFISFSSFL